MHCWVSIAVPPIAILTWNFAKLVRNLHKEPVKGHHKRSKSRIGFTS